MKSVNDYESLGHLHEKQRFTGFLPEAFSGSSIVSWYGQIENQLQGKLDDQEASRNFENADRIRAFLNTWRENEITGAINVEQLGPLKAAAEQQASAKWPLRSYFSSLRNQLRKLIASEEELPRGVDTDQINPMSGGGLGRGAPPMSPDFGPDKEAPTDLEGGETGLEPGPGEAEGDLGDLGAEKALNAAEDEAGKLPRK